MGKIKKKIGGSSKDLSSIIKKEQAQYHKLTKRVRTEPLLSLIQKDSISQKEPIPLPLNNDIDDEKPCMKNIAPLLEPLELNIRSKRKRFSLNSLFAKDGSLLPPS